MAYATGRCMCDEILRRPFNAEHVCQMVRKVYSGRVRFHDGDGEIAPGVTVHEVPGHSKGLQCVGVLTQSGWVVLASDASHLYENFERRHPFPIVVDVEATLKSYDCLQSLATSRRHIMPGHDPLVLMRYPALDERTQVIVHRFDVPPHRLGRRDPDLGVSSGGEAPRVLAEPGQRPPARDRPDPATGLRRRHRLRQVRGFEQPGEVDAGRDAHVLEREHQVFCRRVAGGARRERTSA